jgi:MraZ protein
MKAQSCACKARFARLPWLPAMLLNRVRTALARMVFVLDLKAAMLAFVSTFAMKCDAKGRVSIPKPFRLALGADPLEGPAEHGEAAGSLFCTPSPDGQAIDAGGGKLFSMLQGKLSALDPTSFDYDLLATAFFGESEVIGVEKEGRITLPPRLKEGAGIEDHLVFVGKGHKFQIWSPQRYAGYRARAVEQARAVLWGAAPTAMEAS